ncbi:GmrSD restriction endonuclease domain-containing protein [Streptomyces marincola]|uniref:GmrSD restriction endonucleases N-terminal domain-containing protein n=1 Tax=Streptomyces marincola TaxID=2878388 RepID=A0A1W7D1Z1_9ACTN|nr:DUF262 domain-containing protein [Streptomyces marincola]ARQ71015.1 hypothetical protein CAG99_21180 [Streptomyces marincola]
MAVERTNRDVRTLITQIAGGEIMLPEIQRGYMWKASQVARLVESLYRGYPAGSLLFWKTGQLAETREAAIGAPQALPSVMPLYLLDGQQRLTSLYRVLTDHPEAQVVFNVETEVFQNQSAATRRDKKWIKVYDVVGEGADVFAVHSALKAAGLGIPDAEIGRRLNALQKITQRDFHMEVLHDFEYGEVAEIFVRVNSGGRALKTTDLALATLSARSPGFLGRLEAESARWAERGYALDVNFLIKALTLSLSISGKRSSSVARLTAASKESVEAGWEKVRRGLTRVVPLLQEKLLIPTTALIPSLAALHPLVVYYGRRPEGADVPPDVEDGMLYWFMAATARSRYGGVTDTLVTQDIRALDAEDPVRALLANLGIRDRGITVSADDLAGRNHQSPYLMFCYLAAAHARASDWWDGSPVSAAADGSGKPQHSLVHPASTLRGHRNKYSTAEINELANIVFVSQETAKNIIGNRSPEAYLRDLLASDLAAHSVPEAREVLSAARYRDFLSARRALLAARITALLNGFRPAFLTRGAPRAADASSDRSLTLSGYSTGGRAVLAARAEAAGRSWVCCIDAAEIDAALDAAAVGLASDVRVGGDTVPMRVDDEGGVTLVLGPFLVRGSLDQWHSAAKDAFDDAQPLTACPEPTDEQWPGEPAEFLLSEAAVRGT